MSKNVFPDVLSVFEKRNLLLLRRKRGQALSQYLFDFARC